jgi:hypothetical protein
LNMNNLDPQYQLLLQDILENHNKYPNEELIGKHIQQNEQIR